MHLITPYTGATGVPCSYDSSLGLPLKNHPMSLRYMDTPRQIKPYGSTGTTKEQDSVEQVQILERNRNRFCDYMI
jgi:hypothetical protein